MMVAVFATMVLALGTALARVGGDYRLPSFVDSRVPLGNLQSPGRFSVAVVASHEPWYRSRMSSSSAFPARVVDLALLAILIGLAAILTVAMGFQYIAGELPCPLCLLQRVAMFGICFGILYHVRNGYDVRNIGVSLVWSLFLLIVSVRQVLLNIVARPGHAYPGSAVLGIHMPVWSVVIALTILLVLAATLALFDSERLSATQSSPAFAWAGAIATLYVIALCAINLVSAVLQCGFGACHTTGYKLL